MKIRDRKLEIISPIQETCLTRDDSGMINGVKLVMQDVIYEVELTGEELQSIFTFWTGKRFVELREER